jgi:hypothetical protein
MMGDKTMSDADTELGPVDYLVLAFPAVKRTSRGRWRPSWGL